jgi:hypothetical protein
MSAFLAWPALWLALWLGLDVAKAEALMAQALGRAEQRLEAAQRIIRMIECDMPRLRGMPPAKR